MFNGAREGLIPVPVLAKISRRKKAPWVALIAYIAVAVLLVVVFAWNEEPGEFLAKAGTLGAAGSGSSPECRPWRGTHPVLRSRRRRRPAGRQPR